MYLWVKICFRYPFAQNTSAGTNTNNFDESRLFEIDFRHINRLGGAISLEIFYYEFPLHTNAYNHI